MACLWMWKVVQVITSFPGKATNDMPNTITGKNNGIYACWMIELNERSVIPLLVGVANGIVAWKLLCSYILIHAFKYDELNIKSTDSNSW